MDATRGWLSSHSTTSEGRGLLCILLTPPHFCSIPAGMSLELCTLYIYSSLGLFCQRDQPSDLRPFPQVSWQSEEPNFRCPRGDTRSPQGCCKLLSGAGGHGWLSGRKWDTELFPDPSKTQVKGCAGPGHGPALLGSKGCSGCALPRHHGGDLPPLRSPWGKKNKNKIWRCNQIKNKIK